MLKFFRDLLGDSTENNPQHYSSDSVPESSEKKLQLATCALFLEVAHADESFQPEEREKIISVMKDMFELNEDEVDELIKQSNEIVKNLWRLILVDEKINKYEEHFVRTITNNFHLEHQDMIAAKLEVKEELGL
jgi:uncharacterized tellurite resistance protein B-like protein